MDAVTDDQIVHRDFSARSISETKRSIEVLASTNSLDSHNTILDQDWRLDRYRRNPVVLWNHNRFEHGPFSLGGGVRPEDFLPIGRAENVRVESEGLVATIVFAKADTNPLADRILRMYLDRLLRSVSVGFRPGTVTKETIDGREILRLGQNELYEISAVPVPSNPDAVARSMTSERQYLAQLARGRAPRRDESQWHVDHHGRAYRSSNNELADQLMARAYAGSAMDDIGAADDPDAGAAIVRAAARAARGLPPEVSLSEDNESGSDEIARTAMEAANRGGR